MEGIACSEELTKDYAMWRPILVIVVSVVDNVSLCLVDIKVCYCFLAAKQFDECITCQGSVSWSFVP